MIIIFFLNSCHISNYSDKNFIQINNQNSTLLDFDTAIENIIIKISKLKDIFMTKDISFFIDSTENKTNLIINKEYLINLIKKKLYKQNKNINFLEENIIKENKKKLGILHTHDNLKMNIAILLSRMNHVKYYLHSYFLGKKDPYSLKIELILVETGEIIFTGIEKLYYKK